MHKYLKTYAVALLFLLLPLYIYQANNTQAAGDYFSSDTEEYLKQVEEYFKTATDRVGAKNFITKLSTFMQSEDGDEQWRSEIISLSNSLKRLRTRPAPDFINVISVYMDMKSNTMITGENLQVWKSVLNDKLKQKNAAQRAVVRYMLATRDYLSDGSLCVSPSSKWHVSGDAPKFENRDGHLLMHYNREIRLVCLSQNDSIDIVQTAGYCDIDEKKWYGAAGVVTWEKCGLPINETYAKFGEYKVDLTKHEFRVDSVRFVNLDYFKDTMIGRLEHKVVNRNTKIGRMYPKFYTTANQVDVVGIFPGLDYHGGFSQVGSTFQGCGVQEAPAEVDIYRNDTIFIVAKAFAFNIDKKGIDASSAEISMKLADRVIEHPGVRFRFSNANHLVELIRMGENLEDAYYYDNYHNVNIDAQYISWDMTKDEMELKMVGDAAFGIANFESLNYYSDDYYNQLQGMEFQHPFQHIADFYRFNGGNPFTVADYAAYRQLPEGDLRKQFIDFSYSNFVDYDYTNDLVTPRPRLFNYLKFKLAQKDYDVIRFQSVTDIPDLRSYDQRKISNYMKSHDVKDPFDHIKPNGVLDLKNYDILLNGVAGVQVSKNEMLDVAIYPDNGQLKLKKDLDFEFDGRVRAGDLLFTGSAFYFNYNTFSIDLKNIDNMKIKAETNEKLAGGGLLTVEVPNTLSNFSGHIEIDNPNNKSGKKYYPEFPRLTTDKEAYVYYDDPSIQGGRYNRENFYFRVDTFSFSGFNHIHSGDTLPMKGTLVSGIIPDLDQQLVVRDREHLYSLGFIESNTSEGFPLYDNKAMLYANIDMSNLGLRAGGDFTYMTSRSRSEDFLLLPDKTIAYTYDFEVQKTTDSPSFPEVSLGPQFAYTDKNEKMHVAETDFTFLPQRDQLHVSNTDERFRLYSNPESKDGYDCLLDGELIVTPSGLGGSGCVSILDANLEARSMTLTHNAIESDSTYFATYKYDETNTRQIDFGGLRHDIIKNKDDRYYHRSNTDAYDAAAKSRPTQMFNNMALRENAIFDAACSESIDMYNTISSTRMHTLVDFDKRESYSYYTNGIGNNQSFALVRYITTLDRFTWDMKNNRIVIGEHGSRGNRFVCTKERRDSLNFLVPVAYYDNANGILSCEEVKNIKTADAEVLLDTGGYVTIRKNAEMDMLYNTKIVLESDNSRHVIFNAKTQIEGAKKYHASGDYNFINAVGDIYRIFMSDVHTDDNDSTVANGRVSEDANFTFNKYFGFKGGMQIKSGRQFLFFNGGAKLLQQSAHGPKGYVYFESLINPAEVIIPIGERITNAPTDMNTASEIHRDFLMHLDSMHVYSSFLEGHQHPNDHSMLRSEGELYYHPSGYGRLREGYTISSTEKRENFAGMGSSITYLPQEDRIFGFGKIDMQLTGDDYFYVESAGDLNDDRANGIITTNMLSYVDFPFANELVTDIYNDIIENATVSCASDTNSALFERRLAEVIQDTAALKMLKQTRHTGLIENEKTKELLLPVDGSIFTFNNLIFRWYTPKKAYICDTTVNLVMMRNRNVLRKVKLKAEFVNRATPTQSKFTMLISFGDDHWYYFRYMANTMMVLSSSAEFNQKLQAIPGRDRRVRKYTYTLAPGSQRKKFLEQFGINDIEIAPEEVETEEEVSEIEN